MYSIISDSTGCIDVKVFLVIRKQQCLFRVIQLTSVSTGCIEVTVSLHDGGNSDSTGCIDVAVVMPV